MDNDYVTSATLYKSLSWDEDGYECYSLFDSYDAALDESDFEEDRVQAVPGLLPTQKLIGQSLVNIELLDVSDIITALYAEQVLDYDGIYWDEILDVASYSAPRGVIFNSKLSSFDVVNLTARKRDSSLDHIIEDAASRTNDFLFDTIEPVR